MAPKKQRMVAAQRLGEAGVGPTATERQVARWVEVVSGIPVEAETLCEQLLDGVALCKLLARAQPGATPAFYQVAKTRQEGAENVKSFLFTCEKLGLGAPFEYKALRRKETATVAAGLAVLATQLCGPRWRTAPLLPPPLRVSRPARGAATQKVSPNRAKRGPFSKRAELNSGRSEQGDEPEVESSPDYVETGRPKTRLRVKAQTRAAASAGKSKPLAVSLHNGSSRARSRPRQPPRAASGRRAGQQVRAAAVDEGDCYSSSEEESALDEDEEEEDQEEDQEGEEGAAALASESEAPDEHSDSELSVDDEQSVTSSDEEESDDETSSMEEGDDDGQGDAEEPGASASTSAEEQGKLAHASTGLQDQVRVAGESESELPASSESEASEAEGEERIQKQRAAGPAATLRRTGSLVSVRSGKSLSSTKTSRRRKAKKKAAVSLVMGIVGLGMMGFAAVGTVVVGEIVGVANFGVAEGLGILEPEPASWFF